MTNRCVLALVTTLALLMPQAGATYDEHAPTTVVAQGVGGVLVLVAWTASSAPVDAYRVYGVTSSGSLEPLALVDSDTFTFSTSTSYDGFAVSGVKVDLESVPVPAIVEPCVTINMQASPPQPYTDVPDCVSGLLPTGDLGLTIRLP